jgi:transposase
MGAEKRYPKEFKLEAAKLVVERGYSFREAAKQLGVGDSSIRYWIDKYTKSGDLPCNAYTKSAAEELVALRKENQKLKVENEILKKAAAYFARESL